MNIILAFTLFALVILIYWIITEFFTMLFRFTGLSDEKARFQVISMLTGSGYTTHESELIVSTKARRRLARHIMLFGYVFNVTFISALINVFISLRFSQIVYEAVGMVIPLAALAVIFLFIRNPRIHTWGESQLQKLAGKFLKQDDKNSVLLLDYIGDDSIAQVTLKKVPERYAGKPLWATSIKREHNILVMLVDRGKAVPATADTVFQPGDKLTVFGNFLMICHAFEAEESNGVLAE